MAIVGTLPITLTNGTTADATQVMADLQFIVDQVNANALPAGTPITPSSQVVRSATTTGGTTGIVNTDGFILIHNTVATLALIPPGVPAANQLVTIKDAGGTAGLYAVTFNGTIDGVMNPTLIDVAYGVAQLLFSGGLVYRVI